MACLKGSFLFSLSELPCPHFFPFLFFHFSQGSNVRISRQKSHFSLLLHSYTVHIQRGYGIDKPPPVPEHVSRSGELHFVGPTQSDQPTHPTSQKWGQKTFFFFLNFLPLFLLTGGRRGVRLHYATHTNRVKICNSLYRYMNMTSIPLSYQIIKLLSPIGQRGPNRGKGD